MCKHSRAIVILLEASVAVLMLTDALRISVFAIVLSALILDKF